jgi:hypothetical protein
MNAEECLSLIRNPDTKDKGLILAAFYKELFNDEVLQAIAIKKLCKLYGYDIVFFGILDCYDVDNFDSRKPYGLLSYFCKRRLDVSNKSNTMNKLDDLAEKNNKLRDRKLRINRDVLR